MKDAPRCVVEIARIKMNLPIYRDEETTREIAREVEETIARIEDESELIDTQKNAVLAAFDYACQKRALEDEYEADNRELAKALERVTSQLKTLISNFPGEAPVPNDK